MINQEKIPAQPQVSRRAFWDTELTALDFNRHARFIITRVFERGTTADQQSLLRYYGQKTILTTLTGNPALLPIARERAKELFQLTDQDFACSTSKPQARNFSVIENLDGTAHSFGWWVGGAQSLKKETVF